MLQKNLTDILSLSYGMDILIVSVTSLHEVLFWQQRLDQMRGQIVKESARILVIYEDWPEGAGNALGTLYAFAKAHEQMERLFHEDLFHALEQGLSIGLYHTAGKGTRLAPITGSEYNSKSRIKLAGMLKTRHGEVPMTLLEAILKQTALFAPKRKGRLSVFWGDQIFIPSNCLQETDADIDLLVKSLAHRPTLKEWNKEEYSKYGMVEVDEDKNFEQLEKLTFETFQTLVKNSSKQTALSLGSFSLSPSFLKALLKEFEVELQSKTGKLDTDPHLWMPLSLTEDNYLSAMQGKGVSSKWAKAHYQRMRHFKDKLSCPPKLLASDLGPQTFWWDFGNHQAYLRNHLKLNQADEEALALRAFFQIPKSPQNQAPNTTCEIKNSVLIDCHIEEGLIENSVCLQVIAKKAHIQKSFCLNVSAQKIDTNESILYNVAENGSLTLKNRVRADNFSKHYGHLKLHNHLQAPISWEQNCEENPLSFAALHQFNQRLHPSEGQQQAQAAHRRIKEAVLKPSSSN